MNATRLHCSRCARRWTLNEPPEGLPLHCPSCGGALGPESPEDVDYGRPDAAYKRKTVAGARLTELLEVRPTRSVYRAGHRRLKSEVRVELFDSGRAEANRGYVETVFRRAAQTAEFRSPFIVSVVDLGRRGDCWFIITEQVGGDLRGLMDRKGQLPLYDVLVAAGRVLRGLEDVEKAGAYHGNVTPEGILVAHNGEAKLDHLGSAPPRAEAAKLKPTPGGRVRCAVQYMAPEQWTDPAVVNVRADLYSLGCVVYEAITGEAAYRGRSAEEIVRKHAEDGGPSMDGIPRPLERFLGRLMARNPEERPASAREAGEELVACVKDLDDAGVLPPRRDEGEGRSVRDLRAAGLWMLAALVLILAALVPPVILYRRRQARKAAAALPEAGAGVTVAVFVRAAPGTEDLPEEERAAMTGLILFVLERTPGMREAGASPAENADDGVPGAVYLLDAEARPGLGRTVWALSFSRRGPGGWKVETQGTSDAGPEEDIATLQQAANDLIVQALARVDPGTPPLPEPEADAPPAAWAAIGRALRAEPADRLQEAEANMDQAAELAPDLPLVGFLAAYYRTVTALESGGEPSRPLPDETVAALPEEKRPLAEALNAAIRDDAEEVENLLSTHLIARPESVRGYYLLGLWRRRQGRANDALVALRHAARLDPLYLPPARANVELMAKSDPEAARRWLEEHCALMPDPESAEMLRRRLAAVLGEPEGRLSTR